jgi:HEAT repeat protein
LLRYKVRTGDRLVEVIGECFASLLTLSFEESLPFVAEYLQARDSDLQGTAVFALAETRRPEAFAVLRDYWPGAPADLRESLLVALAMFRMPTANDFLIGLIAGKDPSACAALSALAIHRDNPTITASIAAAVQANGAESVREWFSKKFPTESEAKVKKGTDQS